MAISIIKNNASLPPILAGSFTPNVKRRLESFYFSVASIFESWVQRRRSPHTQRAYREDVLSLSAVSRSRSACVSRSCPLSTPPGWVCQ